MIRLLLKAKRKFNYVRKSSLHYWHEWLTVARILFDSARCVIRTVSHPLSQCHLTFPHSTPPHSTFMPWVREFTDIAEASLTATPRKREIIFFCNLENTHFQKAPLFRSVHRPGRERERKAYWFLKLHYAYTMATQYRYTHLYINHFLRSTS